MPLLYKFAQLTVGTALHLGWRPTVEGLEHLPATGGAILAGNHLSVADELFLGAAVPRHIAFWAKAEYFTGTGARGWLTRSVIGGLGAIRVERGGGRAALSAFDGAIPVLRSGGLVAVYPEGTRSPDGRLYRGRTGMIRLALGAAVPIIPVGVLGTDRIQPIGARMPKLGAGKVILRFGKPMDFTGRTGDSAGLRAMTDEVLAEIQKLTGQEYVPRYAPPRGAPPEAPPPDATAPEATPPA
ncbi:MAG TPA: lysophospholipid acyltransferase family protein [Catenuloplanes sp.]